MPDSTVLEDLPEWLVADEILVRLPPKDVLRCRAVRKSWRAATSTDRFILDNHRRQPSLPIIERRNEGISCLAAAGDEKIRHILQYTRDPVSNINAVHHAACDGLLILSRQSSFYICNPATRKCAPMPRPPLRPGFRAPNIVAFYRQDASPRDREYRVLWVIFSEHMMRGTTVEPPAYLVLPVGSDQPRWIQWPTFLPIYPASSVFPPVHHRGALHWGVGFGITVFDTVTETFRQMSRPAQFRGDVVSLFDFGGDLALHSDDCLTLDVWVLQDYDAETWAFRYRIDLRAMEASPPLNLTFAYFAPMISMAVINERELLIQHGPDRLLHCDIEGLFLGNVESQEQESSLNRFANSLSLTMHRLQESMISLPLFEMQDEDALNEKPPFTILL